MEHRTTLIHAGLKKAGSTAIQAFLSENQENLIRLGIHYPVMGRGTQRAHHNIAYEIRERNKFDSRLGTLSQLVDYWRTVNGGTLLVSSEMFEDSEERHITKLNELQIAAGDKLQALFVLRNLVDLAPSGYAQRIKHGRKTFDFDTFFRKQMKQQTVQHLQIVSRWASVMGWDNIHLRVLDSRYLVNGDIMDDLLTLIGVDPASNEAAELSRPGMVNVAPGWKALEAIRALYGNEHGLPESHPLASASLHPNAYRKLIGQEAARIAENLGWNNERGHYLSLEQARRCHEVDTANLLALNERIAVPLPLPPAPTAQTFAAREFLPGADHIPARQLRQLYDELGEFHLRTSRDAKGR